LRNWWKSFRGFLTAEEVPRWFGLSVVLIYLVGMGSIAQFGIAQARRETAIRFQSDSQYAVKLLADRVEAIEGAGATDPKWLSVCQRALREFAANFPAKSVRVVEGRPPGRIIASTNPTETGTTIVARIAGALQPGGLEIATIPSNGSEMRHRLLRAPLGIRELTVITEPDATPKDTLVDPLAGDRFLEVILPFEPVEPTSLANQARMLAIVLAVLGALFVVYRCLREQLRGLSKIANRLELRRDRIGDDLASLRIGDALDGVTVGWNELVDLTERLQTSVQRTEANEELSCVLQRSGGGALSEALNAVPDGLIYISDEVRFEYLNSAACRLLGWNAPDTNVSGAAREPRRERNYPTLTDAQANGLGVKLLELIRGAALPEGVFEARTEVLESGDPPSADHTSRPEVGRRDQGGSVWEGPAHDLSTYRVWLIPLQRARHHGECVVVIRDVSQQIRADRAREEFIAQVTHELRTPLTNIRAYTETLSSGMFEDPKVITECYNVITKETRRLSRLVEDILSVSQLEVGSIELHVDSVDLKTLLSDGVRDVRGLADEKNIDIQLVLPAKLEPVRADRDKLAVVINNLLGNAIKYTPANGNVMVGCQVAADVVVLTFKDNGIGIDPSEHARVFEKFQRGSNPEVQSESGTGIGLYTAREIVRRHGGDIELLSEKDKGSTFMVRLPHRESRAAAVSTVGRRDQGGSVHDRESWGGQSAV
jgi:signal transduction histidine kinase